LKALYVAPELLKPNGVNKYTYTQKVDIYSLGIVFYEMCFTFETNMERVLVLQNLRKPEIQFPNDIDFTAFTDQTGLIKKMLNHDPNQRPSAKQLLRNECVPRNSNEIALDELLRYSLSNKNSSNYSKILKTLFEQNTTKSENFSYDIQNCKQAISFKYLQIREHVYNVISKLFQKSGGYMLSYPLLMPYCGELGQDFHKAFLLIDSSGLVLTLPYNHRLQFARYVARSEYNNIKR
jgi:translation initiation factor 2-alpha kinase 4